MTTDRLKEYLKFEAEFIQVELEAFEHSGTEADRFKVLHKQSEAAIIFKDNKFDN